MIPWPLVVLLMVAALVTGLYFGYEFTMRRAQEWIEDHVATDHSSESEPAEP